MAVYGGRAVEVLGAQREDELRCSVMAVLAAGRSAANMPSVRSICMLAPEAMRHEDVRAGCWVRQRLHRLLMRARSASTIANVMQVCGTTRAMFAPSPL